MPEENRRKSRVFQPLVVKPPKSPVKNITQEFYEVSKQSQINIENKCKDLSDKLEGGKKEFLQVLEQSHSKHEKALRLLDEQLKQAEQWKGAIRSLHAHIQANVKSQQVRKFVHNYLTSFDETKKASGSKDFNDWKQSLLKNFDEQIVAAARKESFQYTDLQEISSSLQQNLPESTVLQRLPALIKEIEQAWQWVDSEINRVNELLTDTTSDQQRLELLEAAKVKLEKLLEDNRVSHLSSEVLQNGRAALDKCEESINRIRLESEMSAALLSLMRKFPHIEKSQSMALAMREFNQPPSSIATLLSQHQCLHMQESDLQSQWQYIVETVRNPSGQSGASKAPLFKLSNLITKWSDFLLHLFSEGHNNTFHIMISQSIDLCWEKFRSSSAVDDASYGALLIYGLYRLLTARSRVAFVKILKGKVFQNSLLIPNFLQPERSLTSPNAQEQCNFALLVGSIVAYSADNVSSDTNGPLDASFGWNFLTRSAQQLHFIVNQPSMPKENTISINTICVVMYQFMQTAGPALFSSYQCKFEDMLVGLEQIIANLSNASNAVRDLRELIQTALRNRRMPVLPYYNRQDPAVVNLTLQASSCEMVWNRYEDLSSHKDSPFALRCKELRVGPTTSFNRVSVTEESQRFTHDQITNKIMECSNEDPEILRYTLYKVVKNLLDSIQAESLSHTKQAQPLMFARVTCMVCATISDLSALLRNLFYNTCPPLMPKVVSEGVGEDDFLLSLGFVWKGVKNSTELKPETTQSWLLRMEKIITVVALISIQPEQTPFQIGDMWTLITRMTNSVAQLPSPAPFYLPSMYNILLRITSSYLMQKYGNSYLSLVRLINNEVFPKFESSDTKTKLVKLFLDSFLNSNGSHCDSFFSPDES